jgi:putative oxidoreductase
MKHLPSVAGALLGLMFIASGAIVVLGLAPQVELPKDTPIDHFMAAFGPTGYILFVKVIEIVGGILVAIPRTRNLGLLALGPIIVNILAFHTFVTAGEGLFSWMILVICALAVFLLWAERRAWAGLIHRN